MSKARFKKQLLAAGLSLALAIPFSMSSAKALANTDRNLATTGAAITTESVSELRIQAETAIFLISSDGTPIAQPKDAELAAGDYCLVLGLATFSDVSDSKVRIKFDDTRLSWEFWAEDQDNQRTITEDWVDLKPAGELSLEMSDMVSVYRAEDDTTEIIHSAQFCEAEGGGPLTLTPEYLQDYLDMVCLCFDFWVG